MISAEENGRHSGPLVISNFSPKRCYPLLHQSNRSAYTPASSITRQPTMQTNVKQEISYLLTALVFFTRIPIPQNTAHDRQSLNQALKYFPLIGWLVGALSALFYALAALIWPQSVAVIIALAGAVLVTGALHEDGFADCCDGFGGGWDKAQVLTIMKDPRVGSYGAIGLALLFIVKLLVLLELGFSGSELVVIALLVSHPASRLLVLILTCWLDYVGSSDDSKSNNMVAPGFSLPMFGLSSLFVLLPVWLMNADFLFSSIFIAAVAVLLFGFYCKRRIGGYTGDCLGASQQIGEVIIYLSILAQWTST